MASCRDPSRADSDPARPHLQGTALAAMWKEDKNTIGLLHGEDQIYSSDEWEKVAVVNPEIKATGSQVNC